MEVELLGRKRTSVGKIGRHLFIETWADAVFPMQKRTVSVQIQLFPFLKLQNECVYPWSNIREEPDSRSRML